MAIWQTLDQNEHWFSDPSEQLKDADGNWSTKPGTLCTPTTPLAPFRDAQGEYHTSDGVRKWATLGYSYPELQRWNFAEGEAGETAYLADINRRITKLYSSTRGIVLDDSKASYFTTEMEGDHHVTTHDDWIVNIRFERCVILLAALYCVLEPGSDEATYYAGTHSVGRLLRSTSSSATNITPAPSSIFQRLQATQALQLRAARTASNRLLKALNRKPK